MTEEKDLVRKDIFSRVPYNLYVSKYCSETDTWSPPKKIEDAGFFYSLRLTERIKPYLRPMSSMTKEEMNEFLNVVCSPEGSKYFHLSEEGINSNDAEVQEGFNFELHWINFSYKNIEKATDWLNKKMLDWRGLIPKKLAIEAPESMYN